MKIFISIIAFLLCGCGATWNVANDYFKVKPIKVPLSADRTSINNLDIKFHATEPRATVAAAFSSAMSEAWSNGPTQFESRLEEFKQLYQKSLLDVMKQKGMNCEILRTDPHVDLFMFEFHYKCRSI